MLVDPFSSIFLLLLVSFLSFWFTLFSFAKTLLFFALKSLSKLPQDLSLAGATLCMASTVILVTR
jgi:hypothetical protein